jgi:alpha/beta superfamily hydrolase
MPRTRPIAIAGPAGRLEAVIMTPDDGSIAAGLVCHAHPLHGGIMHYKVMFRAARALQAQGLPALRFNFRGVGTSEGVHDNGRGEQEDVRAALDELERLYPGLPLVLGGYSFGSLMALLVGADDPRVRAMFALGFPVDRVSDTSFLNGSGKPRLFVQGEEDEFGSGAKIEALAERLPEPGAVKIIPGGDHFFTGKLDPLEHAVSEWIAEKPWERI